MVNSSVVLVDYVNRERRVGVDRRKAVMDAGLVRFRPIMLKTLQTEKSVLPTSADAS